MSNDQNPVEKKLKFLEESEKLHLKIGKLALEADDAKIFQLDFFIQAALKRSLHLIFGFTSLIRQNNFLAAAPLIRLHLDTLLRLSAGSYVDDPHDFVTKILDGQQINKMKDTSGAKMTDRRLVDNLTKEFPWIEKVYANANGYVHLSDKHLFNTVRFKEDRTFKMVIGKSDNSIPQELLIESIDVMTKVTDMILNACYSWYMTKEDPSKFTDQREKYLAKRGIKKKASPK